MASDNYRQVRRILWIILVANFAVAAVKVAVGTIIRSASLTADGFHSITDGSSNVVGLIGLHFASRPVDADHPYGHHKFETLTGIFIAGMLAFIGGKVVFDAIDRFSNPVEPSITIVSLISLLATLAVNVAVSVSENRSGKRLGSYILVSDSLHTRSDIFVTIGVFVSLVGIRYLDLPPLIDPIVSLAVAGFILYAAYGILRSATDILVDKAAVDTARIRGIALGFPEVRDVHEIRSRGTGASLFIDMHIHTDPEMSVAESHDLIHHIEKHIQKEIGANAQVIVHIEPYGGIDEPDEPDEPNGPKGPDLPTGG